MVQQIVVVKKDVFVVDSRLIAQELGVNHSDWYSNIIKKYQTEIEQEFGSLRFDNEVKKRQVGATTEKFVWLTEDQSYFLITLSKNTPQVIKCKANLVKAFSLARKANNADAIAFLISCVTREHKAWEVHFTPDWIREAERLTGWSWNWACMAGFINKSVYDVLPAEFRQKLDEVNPIVKNGKRARKQHQHVAPTADEKVLKQIIAETLGMMRGSASEQDYWRSHHNAYSNGFQLTLVLGGGENA